MNTSWLDVGQFPGFVEEVHRLRPFRWQSDLVHEVMTTGWPSLVAIPTGLGKTLTLDVAVFTLALGAPLPPEQRVTPNRIFMLVNRRLVVDQNADHAQAIAEALRDPPGPITAAVAARLASLAGPGFDDHPLRVVSMRGGTDWSWRWLEAPHLPAIVSSTIDQYGSRRLFRGYGVGERLRSLDAALTGASSLVLLDEAHLSPAFATTLATADQLEVAPAVTTPAATPSTVVALTATPAGGGRSIDLTGEGGDAAARLASRKRLTLAHVTGEANAEVGPFGEHLVDVARQLYELQPRPTAILVNTVAQARSCYQLAVGRWPQATVAMLIGRVRGFERGRIAEQMRQRAARNIELETPYLLVATQTVEVGANVDFGNVVTEAAPLDALIQRIGRADRYGIDGKATVVVVAHRKRHGHDDPVYQGSALRAFDWLAEYAGRRPVAIRSIPRALTREPHLVVTIADLTQFSVDADPTVFAPTSPAPPLLPEVYDAWTRTCPTPTSDPPVAPYLHGRDTVDADVQICWRADLGGDTDRWPARLNNRWPQHHELVAVPVWAARAWLEGATGRAEAVSDLDRTAAPDSTDADTGERPPPVLLLRPSGDATVTRDPRRLRPGDVVVVASSYGGHDHVGWAPHSQRAVPDVADVDAGATRNQIRLHPDVLALLVPEQAPPLRRLVAETLDTYATEGEVDPVEILHRLQEVLAAVDDIQPYSAAAVDAVQRLNTQTVRVVVTGDGQLLLAGAPIGAAPRGDDERSSTAAQPVDLNQHSQAVADRAEEFATRAGLEAALVAACRWAGRLHDIGKAEPRFQAMLRGGFPGAGALLAKSGMDPRDRQAFAEAARLSKWPGLGHEALSAAAVTAWVQRGTLDPSIDWDLVIHLVASHHGNARPWPRLVVDPDPTAVSVPMDDTTVEIHTGESLDPAQPARLQRLQRRYGRVGVALLEAVVRLADIDCSARGT